LNERYRKEWLGRGGGCSICTVLPWKWARSKIVFASEVEKFDSQIWAFTAIDAEAFDLLQEIARMASSKVASFGSVVFVEKLFDYIGTPCEA